MFSIMIDLNDRELELKLGRRLAELSGSLDIILGSGEVEGDEDLLVDRSAITELLPVSKGLSIISEM